VDWSIRAWTVFVVVLTGCHDYDSLTYGWDDRRLLCSQSVDDLSQDYDVQLVEDLFRYAEDNNVVALLHAHEPGRTVSLDAIEYTLSQADRHHLDYVGYDELDAEHAPHAAFAFAFDDDSIDAWFAARDVFAAHGAHVTFFVTRFAGFTEEGKFELQQLAADGHHIEAHSIDHVSSKTYVDEHGLDAYIAEEVVPSFEVLRADGYAPTSFAFPFGSATETTWNRVLATAGVDRVRLSPGDCPY
jgi:Polysaccharide deacetylase